MAAELVTLAQVKEYLGITKTSNDGFLQSLIDSTSWQLERYIGKLFEPNPALVQAASTTVAGSPTAAGVGKVQIASATGIAQGQTLQVTTSAGAIDSVPVLSVAGAIVTLDGVLDHPHAVRDQVIALADTNAAVAVTVPINYKPAQLSPPERLAPAAWGGLNTSPPFPMALAAAVDVKIPHARQVSSVSWDSTILTTSQYTLETDPTLRGGPFYRRVLVFDSSLNVAQNLTVTGKFGLWPVPPDILDFMLTVVARRYREKDASWGDIVQSGDGGTVTFFRQLPVSARAILDSYIELGA